MDRPAPAGPGAPRAAAALAAALHAEVARPLPPMATPWLVTEAAARPNFALQGFADHNDPGVQLRGLRHVRLLRLWDDRRISVYVGVNRAGLPGLHFQQRDPDDLPPTAPGTVSSDFWLLKTLLPRLP